MFGSCGDFFCVNVPQRMGGKYLAFTQSIKIVLLLLQVMVIIKCGFSLSRVAEGPI